MGVIAFLDVRVGELDFADLVIAALTGNRADLEFVALDGHDVEVVQVNRIAGVGDNGTDVAGQKILVLAHAKNQWAAAPCSDDEVGNIPVHESDSVRADNLTQGDANGIDKAAFLVRELGLAVAIRTCIGGTRRVVKLPD